ncbi:MULTISPECIES: hypothetical protein [Campylobacter]|uniref:Putative nucleic-acid-binding protein (DUF448 domain) n=1 Tax=Campylobacter porcelli TaxID=1660073 RepID=A0A1X9SY89_9BACT|nr:MULTISPECIES: hypothetical protein [unclassified Campylobacter]MCR8679167.1 hypothetical protein [Campylobacter sp. RM19072]MCR8696007.1 hypothetical protein [Campylobacter sp. RM19073]MEE3704738.1 hypothetical protein [Campylobacter sp. CX2-8023-23]MEE3744711.1 hypothetical protein [Campylobacter sp. CX2-4855-23]MEE3776436.1 hypothetical protein [Campylobacter sp. CX2-4080-23]
MRKFHKPIRMCVVCKGRFHQKELYKFRSLNGEIVRNLGSARSFYICINCINKDPKDLKKPLAKFGKNSINLKEIIVNGKD